MTFKVGDKVVGNAKGYSHRIGKVGIVAVVDGDAIYVNWGDGKSYVNWCDSKIYVPYGGIDLAEPASVEPAPIGKTLTKLDVKPGDVVRYTNPYQEESEYFPSTMTFEIKKHGFITDAQGTEWKISQPVHKFVIVSRAPQPTAEPAKPKRMHPDDVADAMMQYAFDCGYHTEIIKLSSENGSYTYDV